MDSTYQQFHAIVAGSGPGGATVARELTRRNKKVLILEWGSNAPIKGTVLQTIAMGGIPFKNVLLTNQLLAMVRGTTTGGSSIFYYGTAFDPPFDMLKKYGVNIADEIDEARNELPILQTEHKNLYVCDCSVIPEAWGLPPTLTLIGLGKRLAKHLSQEERS